MKLIMWWDLDKPFITFWFFPPGIYYTTFFFSYFHLDIWNFLFCLIYWVFTIFWFYAFTCCFWHFNMHLILTVFWVKYEMSQGLMFQMLGLWLMALFLCGNLGRRGLAGGSRSLGMAPWGCLISVHVPSWSLLCGQHWGEEPPYSSNAMMFCPTD